MVQNRVQGRVQGVHLGDKLEKLSEGDGVDCVLAQLCAREGGHGGQAPVDSHVLRRDRIRETRPQLRAHLQGNSKDGLFSGTFMLTAST